MCHWVFSGRILRDVHATLPLHFFPYPLFEGTGAVLFLYPFVTLLQRRSLAGRVASSDVVISDDMIANVS
jgi:hypothetical protein